MEEVDIKTTLGLGIVASIIAIGLFLRAGDDQAPTSKPTENKEKNDKWEQISEFKFKYKKTGTIYTFYPAEYGSDNTGVPTISELPPELRSIRRWGEKIAEENRKKKKYAKEKPFVIANEIKRKECHNVVHRIHGELFFPRG